MKIALFGATGRVGSQILSLALQDGHHVTALVRSPEKLASAHPNLLVIKGDSLQPADVERVMDGQDAVISALNTGGASNLSDSMPLIMNEMRKNGIKRIITVGTAGILESRSVPGLLRYQARDASRKYTLAAEDHHRAYMLLSESELDWTIVCPTYLPDGERVGLYRIERDYLPDAGTLISVSDTAEFTYSQLTDTRFIGCRVGVAY